MIILAVEKNEEDLKKLEALLHSVYSGAEIISYVDPLLAIKYVYAFPVNAVFADVEMPKLNGFAMGRLIRKVQKRRKSRFQLHFLAQDEKMRTDAVKFMADSYTVKPVSEEKIRSIKFQMESELENII